MTLCAIRHLILGGPKFPASSMSNSQILIIGSRGMVGSAIAAAAGPRAVKAARAPAAPDTLPFDALTDDLAKLLEPMKTPPQAAVIAFGISGVHTCAKDPIKSRHLNIDRVVAIATAAAKFGVLPVLFSTDCVFDGSPVLWSENDEARPICEYGRQKLTAEQAVAATGVPHITIRLSRVIADLAGQRDLLFQWCDRISKGLPVQIPTDQTLTPIAAADVGKIIVDLIDSDLRGLIHTAGPEEVSTPTLFELLCDSLRVLGVNIQVKRDLCRVADLPGLDPRPPSTMLSIKRLQQIVAPRFTPLPDVVRSVATTAFAAAHDRPPMGAIATS